MSKEKLHAYLRQGGVTGELHNLFRKNDTEYSFFLKSETETNKQMCPLQEAL